jgi:2',3'-cyclic-nucleotide 2'-phosphodiesterase (5'-nucleotidase family)
MLDLTHTHSCSLVSLFFLDHLKALKLDAACLGNHDLDLGIAEFAMLAEECSFPWICSNVRDKHTSEPLGGCEEYVILESKNETGPKAKFLVLGLVEEEWIDTLSTIEASDIIFEDFVLFVKRRVPEVNRRVAQCVRLTMIALLTTDRSTLFHARS